MNINVSSLGREVTGLDYIYVRLFNVGEKPPACSGLLSVSNLLIVCPLRAFLDHLMGSIYMTHFNEENKIVMILHWNKLAVGDE